MMKKKQLLIPIAIVMLASGLLAQTSVRIAGGTACTELLMRGNTLRVPITLVAMPGNNWANIHGIAFGLTVEPADILGHREDGRLNVQVFKSDDTPKGSLYGDRAKGTAASVYFAGGVRITPVEALELADKPQLEFLTLQLHANRDIPDGTRLDFRFDENPVPVTIIGPKLQEWTRETGMVSSEDGCVIVRTAPEVKP